MGWRGPQKVSSSTFCSKQSQLQGQRRLLRALSSLVLKTSKNEDYTTSFGKLFQCFFHIVRTDASMPKSRRRTMSVEVVAKLHGVEYHSFVPSGTESSTPGLGLLVSQYGFSAFFFVVYFFIISSFLGKT